MELRLRPYRARFLPAIDPLKAATELVYDTIHQLIHRYVRTVKDQFRCEHIALFGVLIVNTGPDYEDYIDLRHTAMLRVAGTQDQQGRDCRKRDVYRQRSKHEHNH